MMTSFTVASCLQLASQLASVSDTPRLDVEIILAHILQKTRTYLFAWPDAVLNETQSLLFQDFFSRRLKGEPIAHIVGVREFWSLPFAVNNSTLIPRPDTELLVETAFELFAGDKKNTPRDILDLGTGTGAIILSLAHEKKSWQCVGVDKELAAVELAEKNRLALQLTNASIHQSDWFSCFSEENKAQYKVFDAIISNPPYIDPADPHLAQGDVRFEPRSALVADNKGLSDIETICAQAKIYLKNEGWLLIEHGHDQGDSVRKLFAINQFIEIKTLRDMGGNERLTLGKYFVRNKA